ncbi:MAG TPA: branched-chain amino acid ABC transporter permease [Pusillimonas sp.]|uniref:branched-chain amino acid ABC transporter permease n=2 Tax=unclassified Pusillimonas TaxID=2640016 RepID=UPI002B4B5704|nr:branched-chain amino acid ABC transporter permease [Pusillimonas sp.]HLU19923.1 branched-chain amino acid ABC transporter permease [Pusillimonas sp.]
MLAIELTMTALTLGGLYALIAMGLTLQYGVARIMNLSHGEFMVGAAFLAYWLVTSQGVHPLFALAIALPVGFVLQWLVYQILLTPLVKRSPSAAALEVDSILATFGILFVVQGIILVLFGGEYYSYGFLASPVNVLGAAVAANRLLAAGFAIVIGLLVYFVLVRSRWGAALRAMANAPQFAHLVGINPRAMAAFAFALGGALVVGAGVLISMFLSFSASMGVAFTMKALVIVIMGGVGNVLGCLLAGMLLGIVETLVSRFIDPGLTMAATFTIFLLVLLLRPQGIFGRATR